MSIATTDPLVSTAQPLATKRLTAEYGTVTNDPEKQLAVLLSVSFRLR